MISQGLWFSSKKHKQLLMNLEHPHYCSSKSLSEGSRIEQLIRDLGTCTDRESPKDRHYATKLGSSYQGRSIETKFRPRSPYQIGNVPRGLCPDLIEKAGFVATEYYTNGIELRVLVVRLSSISRENFLIPRRTVDTLYLLIEEAEFEAISDFDSASISGSAEQNMILTGVYPAVVVFCMCARQQEEGTSGEQPRVARAGSRRTNTRIKEEAPRVGYCYARGNQQREFLTHLLVYAPAGLSVCRLVLMTKERRRRFTCERKSVKAIANYTNGIELRVLVVRLSSISRENFLIPRRTVDMLYLLIEEVEFEAEERTSGEQPRIARGNCLDDGSAAGRITTS
ncbi:hypothetical protein F511_03515 [Dorcoceras hygrometricum]|uniref:Uncharacterized protein n=1 Tax=Dorcoceras hygrometricum TaxID=472368 RepID=A0A2Z7AAG4_9LAMI|nr:hypothetical protein F511_03515 [Dorcoceras hygrometricum]